MVTHNHLSQPILTLENFSLHLLNKKTHKPDFILNNICLNLPEKYLVILMGSSGSGKSLLCHNIIDNELFRHNSLFKLYGKILYKKHNLLQTSYKDTLAFKRHEISFIPQDPTNYFDPFQKIKNQLYTIIKLSNPMSIKQEMHEQICLALGKLDVYNTKKTLESHPYMLSRGTLQKILIILCMLKNPQLIIADEPTSALDALACEKVLRYFIEFSKTRGSVLLVTHNPDRISNCKNSLIRVMNKGKLV